MKSYIDFLYSEDYFSVIDEEEIAKLKKFTNYSDKIKSKVFKKKLETGGTNIVCAFKDEEKDTFWFGVQSANFLNSCGDMLIFYSSCIEDKKAIFNEGEESEFDISMFKTVIKILNDQVKQRAVVHKSIASFYELLDSYEPVLTLYGFRSLSSGYKCTFWSSSINHCKFNRYALVSNYTTYLDDNMGYLPRTNIKFFVDSFTGDYYIAVSRADKLECTIFNKIDPDVFDMEVFLEEFVIKDYKGNTSVEFRHVKDSRYTLNSYRVYETLLALNMRYANKTPTNEIREQLREELSKLDLNSLPKDEVEFKYIFQYFDRFLNGTEDKKVYKAGDVVIIWDDYLRLTTKTVKILEDRVDSNGNKYYVTDSEDYVTDSDILIPVIV